MAVDESASESSDLAMATEMDPGSGEADDEDGETREILRGRTRTTALSHRHYPHGLDWSADSCVLDDDREITVQDTGNGFHISLVGERDWSEAVISGTITVPSEVYEDVVPATEQAKKDEPPTALHVTIDCRDAILRESHRVASPAGPGEYEFEIRLDADRVYGKVKLAPVLSRREPFDGDSGQCASESGHRLAEVSPSTVAIDMTDDLHGLFQPRKKKFSEDPDLQENHLVHLVLEGDDAPQLYLNDDHEELVEVLDIRGKQGKAASLKEAAYDLIEAELWPQFVMETAANIDSTGEPKEDWQWDVLRQVAEPLYGPDTDPREAGVQLRDTIESPDELPKLQMEIEDFVQSRIDAPSDLMKVLGWLR